MIRYHCDYSSRDIYVTRPAAPLVEEVETPLSCAPTILKGLVLLTTSLVKERPMRLNLREVVKTAVIL